MARKSIVSLFAIALGGSALLASPAAARGGYHHNAPVYHDTGYGYGAPVYARGYDDRNYRDYGNRGHRNNWRGNRGYRCDKGTGGTIVGAIAGGLLGREVTGRYGDRTMGTIIGAGVGAVAGRAIDRSGGNRC